MEVGDCCYSLHLLGAQTFITESFLMHNLPSGICYLPHTTMFESHKLCHSTQPEAAASVAASVISMACSGGHARQVPCQALAVMRSSYIQMPNMHVHMDLCSKALRVMWR